jgi:ACS family tartrate transporter-like MFS transporter
LPKKLPSDVGRAAVSHLSRRLVPFLFLLYIDAYLDRVNVSFAALQMQVQLGFSDAVYGFGAGLFFAGYFVFQVPSNLVLQRVGAKRWLAMLMVAWGAVSSSMMFVSTARGFYILRFLLGLAEAGFVPGVILYMKNWFPADARARTVAWFMTAGPLSFVVGGPISGALLGLHTRGGLAGWQWLFLMEGVPAVLLGAVAYFYLTDHPADAHWLAPQQRAWLIETLERERQSVAAVTRTSTLAAFTNGWIWILVGVDFCLNTASYGISLWLPTMIHRVSGVSSLVIGVLTAIPYLAATAIMVLVGFHSDRSGERRWHIAISAFAGAVALFVGAHSTAAALLIVTMGLAMAGISSIVGPMWALATGMLAGTAAAVGIGLINAVGNLGGFFGPYIIGLARTSSGGFKGGLLVLGAALGLSGILALLVRPARPRAEQA